MWNADEQLNNDDGEWEKDIIWDIESFIKSRPDSELELPEFELGDFVELETPEGEEVANDDVKDGKTPRDESPKEGNSTKRSVINYNISNDEYYQIPGTKKNDANGFTNGLKFTSVGYLRHSKLVWDLQSPFMKTHLDTEALRNFHRPKLTQCFTDKVVTIATLAQHVFRKARKREKAARMGRLDVLFNIDSAFDLSGRDGEIILVENSEEHPPLLSQVGMCSKIVNYYRRGQTKEKPIPVMPHEYGEPIYINASSPFLGKLAPGQVISALENNLYRSPIYLHDNCKTDFLLIVNSAKTRFYIREFDATFTAGQQCPLMEVPGPNSVKTRHFLKNFIKACTFRQLLACRGDIRLIPFENITKCFPSVKESSIRFWLKSVVDIVRLENGERDYVKAKTGFAMPSIADLEQLVTPEQCCAYYSLLAGKQRLEDACHGSLILEIESDCEAGRGSKRKMESGDGENGEVKEYSQKEQEILAAPWNTTSAYIAAAKGKCKLQVTGFADPTGCGEGFSYVRLPKSVPPPPPGPEHQATKSQGNPGSIANGTDADADLRRVSTKKAKEILGKAGVPLKKLQGKTHWQIINMLKTLPAEKMKKAGLTDSAISKFSRRHLKGYSGGPFLEECQRVFDLQNRVLSSSEVLSTDEEEEDDESLDCGWGDMERMGKSIETLFLNHGMSTSDLVHEEEELGRLELQKQMLGKIKEKDSGIAKKIEQKAAAEEVGKKKAKEGDLDILSGLIKNPNRVLRISRTHIINGETCVRTEIVRDPMIIAAYVRIRTTKDDAFIRNFVWAEHHKEKRLQQRQIKSLPAPEPKDNACKVKRIKKKEDGEFFPNTSAKRDAERKEKRKLKPCGACKMRGHGKNDEVCPFYDEEKSIQEKKKKEKKKLKKKQVLAKTANPVANQNDSSSVSDTSTSSDEESDELS